MPLYLLIWLVQLVEVTLCAFRPSSVEERTYVQIMHIASYLSWLHLHLTLIPTNFTVSSTYSRNILGIYISIFVSVPLEMLFNLPSTAHWSIM